MGIKDQMNKEVELDFSAMFKKVIRWWKDILNHCSNVFYYKKRKAWPDETTYRKRESIEPEILTDDDDLFDRLLNNEHIPKILSRNRPTITINGDQRDMTSQEEKALDVAMGKLNDMVNELTDRITVNIHDVEDIDGELDNLVKEMFGAEDEYGMWDSRRNYPINAEGGEIKQKRIIYQKKLDNDTGPR
jgi:hypothetical protein